MKVQEKVNVFSLSEKFQDERSWLVNCVRRWGSMTSDAVLDPACQIFKLPHLDGLIGYRVESNCAVVFGDPVCSTFDIPQLVEAFHAYCKERGWKVIYVIASEKFTHWALEHICGASIQFGNELFMDPQNDPRKNTGVYASLVRRKFRHAEREGLTVHEYTGNDSKLEQAIEQVGKEWLASRHRPQVYISHVRLFDDRAGKRWIYAQKDNQIVGIVVLNQLQAYQGWLLNRLMITPTAPHGTPESLVVTALEIIANEKYPFATFGSIPTDELGQIIGLNKLSAWLTKASFKIANKIFHLEGHKKFWEKYHPLSRPSYVLLTEPHLGLRETLSLMRALNMSVI